jgi:hypothetical protein
LHLCREVETRLLEVRVKCYTITVKLRRRSEGAPVNPSKYLGCGRCDCFSKSTTSKVGIMTAGHMQPHCLRLFRQLCVQYKVVVEDIRGIGIQVSRLQAHETNSTDAQLPFKTTASSKPQWGSFAAASPGARARQTPSAASPAVARDDAESFTNSQRCFIEVRDTSFASLLHLNGFDHLHSSCCLLDLVAGERSPTGG